MRAVLDVNVLVSALLSKSGPPARLVVHWLEGTFELVVCNSLLAELERTLAYPKVSKRITQAEAAEFMELVRRMATTLGDPENPPRVSEDPGDDCLVALAGTSASVLVSGDRHLLALGNELPIQAPAAFLARLAADA